MHKFYIFRAPSWGILSLLWMPYQVLRFSTNLSLFSHKAVELDFVPSSCYTFTAEGGRFNWTWTDESCSDSERHLWLVGFYTALEVLLRVDHISRIEKIFFRRFCWVKRNKVVIDMSPNNTLRFLDAALKLGMISIHNWFIVSSLVSIYFKQIDINCPISSLGGRRNYIWWMNGFRMTWINISSNTFITLCGCLLSLCGMVASILSSKLISTSKNYIAHGDRRTELRGSLPLWAPITIFVEFLVFIWCTYLLINLLMGHLGWATYSTSMK